jgi:nucleotide-binding universal stress UspA family protein
MIYKRILVAIDGSDPSKLALQTAIALAKADGAALAIITVHDERFVEGAAAPEDFSDVTFLIESDERDGKALLERARASAAAAGITDVTVQMLDGEPSAHIVEAAKAHRSDLIVISTHGRTGLSRIFVGSVAEHVIRDATCSVLVARPTPA